MADLELAVVDGLDDPATDSRERAALQKLRSQLRAWRHDRSLRFRARSIIVVEHIRARAADERRDRGQRLPIRGDRRRGSARRTSSRRLPHARPARPRRRHRGAGPALRRRRLDRREDGPLWPRRRCTRRTSTRSATSRSSPARRVARVARAAASIRCSSAGSPWQRSLRSWPDCSGIAGARRLSRSPPRHRSGPIPSKRKAPRRPPSGRSGSCRKLLARLARGRRTPRRPVRLAVRRAPATRRSGSARSSRSASNAASPRRAGARGRAHRRRPGQRRRRASAAAGSSSSCAISVARRRGRRHAATCGPSGVQLVIGAYSSDLSIAASDGRRSRPASLYWEAGAVADRLTGRACRWSSGSGRAGATSARTRPNFAATELASRLGKTCRHCGSAIAVADDDAYASSVADAAESTARERGMPVVVRRSYNLTLPDWPRVMADLAAARPS